MIEKRDMIAGPDILRFKIREKGSAYLYILLTTSIVLLLAIFIYSVIFRKELPRPFLKSSRGKIEKNIDGDWKELLIGERIEEGWEIRSLDNAEGRIDFSKGSNLVISSSTHLQLTGIESGNVRIHIYQGRVKGETNGDQHYHYSFENSSTSAMIGKGVYSIGTDGKGYVEALSHSGDIFMKTPKERVKIKSGFMGKTYAGVEKVQIGTIPVSVLLKVKWPDHLTNRGQVTIHGEASDGAEIYVNDKIETWAVNGKFSVDINLEEGDNIVRISAIDGAGNIEKDTFVITKDTSPPVLNLEASGKWK